MQWAPSMRTQAIYLCIELLKAIDKVRDLTGHRLPDCFVGFTGELLSQAAKERVTWQSDKKGFLHTLTVDAPGFLLFDRHAPGTPADSLIGKN